MSPSTETPRRCLCVMSIAGKFRHIFFNNAILYHAVHHRHKDDTNPARKLRRVRRITFGLVALCKLWLTKVPRADVCELAFLSELEVGNEVSLCPITHVWEEWRIPLPRWGLRSRRRNGSCQNTSTARRSYAAIISLLCLIGPQR